MSKLTMYVQVSKSQMPEVLQYCYAYPVISFLYKIPETPSAAGIADFTSLQKNPTGRKEYSVNQLSRVSRPVWTLP